MKGVLIFTVLTATILTSDGQVTDKKALPEEQVNFLLNNKSEFPDGIYDKADWSGFESSEAVNKRIDLKSIDYNLLNAAVFYFSNKYREDKGRTPLAFSKSLRDAAVFHSAEMLNLNFFDHINNRNRKMKTPYDRAKYFGDENELVGENINEEYIGLPEGEERASETYLNLGKTIVQRWIDSPPHRKNLLNKQYRYLGCGVVIDRSSIKKVKLLKAMATQVFGG